MSRVSIIVETPGLVRVGLPIIADASYDIQHEINAAGSWVVEFPAAEELARRVKSRWRISIVEEGRPGYLLRRGIVTNKDYQQLRGGDVLLRCAGFTRLYAVNRTSTHYGLHFDGTQAIVDIAEELTGGTVTAATVAGVADLKPEVTFNDVSKLGALLTGLEYSRLNILENEDEETFELVSRDDVPDSGFRFVSVQRAGPELMTAAERGIAIIAGSPKIGYNGQELANRIIPQGVDFDNEPLTLEHATTSGPYPVLEGTNPDGSSYWYIEDEDAIYDSELIEAHYNRSDIKNPNDNAADREVAANALYALSAGRLTQTKSDVIAFAGEVANGRLVDARVGYRAKVEFRGRARSFGGVGTFWDLDMFFLINKRRDASAAGGVRGVTFTLTAPEISMAIPSLPEAVPIPPPPNEPPDPPDPTTKDVPDGYGDEAPDDSAPDDSFEPFPAEPALPPTDLLKPPGAPGPYTPCCADTPQTPGTGVQPPPFDLGDGIPVPGCTIPWVAANLFDCRFVNQWGFGHADPGLGSIDGSLNPATDVAIVALSSASGPCNLVCASGGVAHVLDTWDSNTPANFGGDGHNWWTLGLIIPTSNAIDLTGTTGAFRQITFARAAAQLTNGGGPFGQRNGAYDSGVVVSVNRQTSYTGSHHLHADETADATQAVRKDDFLWLWVGDVVRTIDDITIDKNFHGQAFNSSAHFFNAEPVPFSPGGGPLSSIDWLLDSDRVDVITASMRVQADYLVAFPDSVRAFSMAVSVKLTALCAVSLQVF